MTTRIIEQVVGTASHDGPTLLVIAGMHGNEPAGVAAARAVLSRLSAHGVRGEVIALIGNTRALAAKRRYLARDLNRGWTPARLAASRAGAACEEDTEQVELADAIASVLDRARGPVFAIDLHTTSAAGVPFAVVGASPAHREFARALPLPGIVGLEELLEGVLTTYLSTLGCVTIAIEGGQNEATTTRANLEAVVTVALVASRVVDDLPQLAASRALLARARGELPAMIEVASRHAISPEDGFRMEPGFANIQLTTRGTLLARDAAHEIRAPFDGLVLLPLYQAQGSDGFFYGRALE